MAHNHDYSERDHYLYRLAPISFFVFTVEIVAGIVSGSLALIMDASHTFLDWLENLLNTYIAHRATLVRDATTIRKRGFMGSLILIGITSGIMLYEAYEKLADTSHVTLPFWAPAIAALALLMTSWQLWLHLKVPGEMHNINHWAQWIHLVVDIGMSIVALIGTALSNFPGFEKADAWAVLGMVGLIWLRIAGAAYEVYFAKHSNNRWSCHHH